MAEITRRKINFLLLLTFLLSSCGIQSNKPFPKTAASPPTDDSNILAIVHGMIIDGTGSEPIPDGVLVIEGNRIMVAGPAADISIPTGARILDAMQGTILPGIINAHVHNTYHPLTRRSIFLLDGVTSTCDLATTLDSMPQFEMDDPSGPSARGFKAGPVIGPPGGYPKMAGRHPGLLYPVKSPEESRKAVAVIIGKGADVIKIAFEPGFAGHSWPVFGIEEARAVVDEAHARGKLVRAHVTRSDMLELALDCGVDVVEHIPVPLLTEEDWEIATLDEQVFQLPADYEAQLNRMVEQHVLMVPTLSITSGAQDWYDIPEEYKSYAASLFIEPVRRFHDLGGFVVLGNDYDNPGAEGGMPLREMQMLASAGLEPMEIIQAATKYAAIACGHGEELGTLEPGKLSDVIIVDGNPLSDLAALADLRSIIIDGELIYPEK